MKSTLCFVFFFFRLDWRILYCRPVNRLQLAELHFRMSWKSAKSDPLQSPHPLLSFSFRSLFVCVSFPPSIPPSLPILPYTQHQHLSPLSPPHCIHPHHHYLHHEWQVGVPGPALLYPGHPLRPPVLPASCLPAGGRPVPHPHQPHQGSLLPLGHQGALSDLTSLVIACCYVSIIHNVSNSITTLTPLYVKIMFDWD